MSKWWRNWHFGWTMPLSSSFSLQKGWSRNQEATEVRISLCLWAKYIKSSGHLRQTVPTITALQCAGVTHQIKAEKLVISATSITGWALFKLRPRFTPFCRWRCTVILARTSNTLRGVQRIYRIAVVLNALVFVSSNKSSSDISILKQSLMRSLSQESPGTNVLMICVF